MAAADCPTAPGTARLARDRRAGRLRLNCTRAVLLLAAALGGCSAPNPYYDPAKPHHRPTGFANVHVDESVEEPSFWRWQWERLTGTLPAQDAARVPRAPTQAAYLRANTDDVTVTWIGHATALWQLKGLNILTDPVFSERTSPLSFLGPRRAVPLPLRLEELPRIDVVLVSHTHYDHLDRASVVALNGQPGGPPLFVVPLGVERWMRERGIERVRALDWWDRLEVEARGRRATVHFVPAQHWSSRAPWDRNRMLWGGFVVQAELAGAPFSMYYVGDTGYAPHFAEIGARFGGFDFAQIPVGCYEPRWFMQTQHVNEAEAVRIHRDVRSRLSMGVHWGTFRLCDDPIDAPLDGLPRARRELGVSDDAFVLFGLGETRVLRQGGAVR